MARGITKISEDSINGYKLLGKYNVVEIFRGNNAFAFSLALILKQIRIVNT